MALLFPWLDPCISLDSLPDSCPIHNTTFIAQIHLSHCFLDLSSHPLPFLFLPSSTTLSLSFPAFLFSSVILVLPSSSFSSPLTVLLCPLFPFLPLLSFLPPNLHVSLYPLSTSHSPCSSLLSPPPFPLIWLLRYFPLNPLSDVGGCSMLGIDCTLEFVVKAQHRPDNLSLFFSLSGSGERLKLPNRK